DGSLRHTLLLTAQRSVRDAEVHARIPRSVLHIVLTARKSEKETRYAAWPSHGSPASLTQLTQERVGNVSKRQHHIDGPCLNRRSEERRVGQGRGIRHARYDQE